MSAEKIMEQAQVFASAWSVVGGPFDDGAAMEVAAQEKDELKRMVGVLAAERDALAAKLAELEGQEPALFVQSSHISCAKYSPFLGRICQQPFDGIAQTPYYARPVPADQPVNARLLDALKGLMALSDHRVDLRDAAKAARSAIATAEAQQAEPVSDALQDMHDAGREVDRVMAEPAPEEPVAEPVNVRLLEALKTLRDALRDHPEYAQLSEEQEEETGGETAEFSYLVRVADEAIAAAEAVPKAVRL